MVNITNMVRMEKKREKGEEEKEVEVKGKEKYGRRGLFESCTCLKGQDKHKIH